MSENFTFHGQTTFINKPKDTVIRDFQNQYIANTDGETREALDRLKELVALLLSSHDLTPENKEEAVGAAHAVAQQVSSRESSRLTMKGTLQAIKDLVLSAADIAQPVAALVTAIISILKL